MDIAGELYNKYADEISREAVSNERYLKLNGKLRGRCSYDDDRRSGSRQNRFFSVPKY